MISERPPKLSDSRSLFDKINKSFHLDSDNDSKSNISVIKKDTSTSDFDSGLNERLSFLQSSNKTLTDRLSTVEREKVEFKKKCESDKKKLEQQINDLKKKILIEENKSAQLSQEFSINHSDIDTKLQMKEKKLQLMRETVSEQQECLEEESQQLDVLRNKFKKMKEEEGEKDVVVLSVQTHMDKMKAVLDKSMKQIQMLSENEMSLNNFDWVDNLHV